MCDLIIVMLRRGLLAWGCRMGVVLALVCCSVSLLYIITCSPQSELGGHALPRLGVGGGPAGAGGTGPGGGGSQSGPPGKESYQALLQEREEQHRLLISSLKKQVRTSFLLALLCSAPRLASALLSPRDSNSSLLLFFPSPPTPFRSPS